MKRKNFIDFIVDAGLDNPELAKEFGKQMRVVQSEKEIQTFFEDKGYSLSLEDCEKMLRFTPDKDGNLPKGLVIPMY